MSRCLAPGHVRFAPSGQGSFECHASCPDGSGGAESTARATVALREAATPLHVLFWSYRPDPERPAPTRGNWVATTPESVALSKRLKQAGFRFVGPTTVYSTMQACGIVNDHLAGCHVRDAVEQVRR